MIEISFFMVAFFATVIGALSGIGGGIIIKPVIDAAGGMDVVLTSYMSGCTVLSMSCISVYNGRKDKISIDYPITISLSIGACLGGFIGSMAFDTLSRNMALLQSVLLLMLNIFIFVFMKYKDKIKTHEITSLTISVVIGCLLGCISGFLGIGGAPITIAILYYFYSSCSKVIVKRSIFIILFSRLASFITKTYTGIPSDINYMILALMIIGGCLGAMIGGKVSKKLTNKHIDTCFLYVLVLIISINIYNVINLLG